MIGIKNGSMVNFKYRRSFIYLNVKNIEVKIDLMEENYGRD